MNRRKSLCVLAPAGRTPVQNAGFFPRHCSKTGGFGRLGLLPDLSSDLLVAEAASRGVRYDKYFAIGKFCHYIFSPGNCQSFAPEIIRHHSQFFSCISPRNGVLVFRNKFAETITCRAILSGGCELSHGFAVIDLSPEQPKRAQGFLDPVCIEIAPPICLYLSTHHLQFCSADQIRVDPTSVCRAGEKGVNHHPFSHQPSMPAQTFVLVEFLTY